MPNTVMVITYYVHRGKDFKQILLMNSLSSTLHLLYEWDPCTKVIASDARVMYAKQFVIEGYYIFHIMTNMFFFGNDGTGPADESKRTKRVQVWSHQIMGGGFLLFAILLLCEITTSFVRTCI